MYSSPLALAAERARSRNITYFCADGRAWGAHAPPRRASWLIPAGCAGQREGSDGRRPRREASRAPREAGGRVGRAVWVGWGWVSRRKGARSPMTAAGLIASRHVRRSTFEARGVAAWPLDGRFD